MSRALVATLASTFLVVSLHGQQTAPPRQREDQGSFRFKSGVELINVTATVTDATGRFVPGLTRDDFLVWEDNQPQQVTHFSADRVPVSLGILLDTSQSMAGEKFDNARNAIDKFLDDLGSADDEFFLMQFNNAPHLVQDWTGDRRSLSRALYGVAPRGGTAMYDAVADAVPLSQAGRNRKKAIVVISDGNDMTSRTPLADVHQIIRQSEALVYAVGIDCGTITSFRRSPFEQRRGPLPIPFPFPGGRRPFPPTMPQPQPPLNRNTIRGCGEPVDVAALRDLTDDSGGRTEIVRDSRDLNPATAGIADELSRQYYLGYPANGVKDGRWHTIRVEVKNKAYRVRARRGYVAT